MALASTIASPSSAPPSDGVSVAKALSSSTRASIYEHLKTAAEERTVRDVAARFELHPNVARTHLELLAEAGLVEVGRRKHPGGGRPAKVYRAREDVHLDRVGSAGAPVPGAALLVRMLAALLTRPAEPSRSLGQRAHELAAVEGRRLVAEPLPAPRTLEQAADAAVTALSGLAPDLRVLRTGDGWVDLVGMRGAFELLGEVQPGLAETLERGMLAGAFAGAGIPVTLTDAGTALGGALVWRARAAGGGARTQVVPAVTVDTRGQQRERGVVEAMRAITLLRPADVVEVLTEGPGSPAAYARWADRAGHQLLGVERATDGTGAPAIRLLIRKGPS